MELFSGIATLLRGITSLLTSWTTQANDQVAPIHARMPVILDDQAKWDAWLNGNTDDARMLCEPGETPDLSASKV